MNIQDTIDDLIEYWHTTDDSCQQLHDFLDMSWEEYKLYIHNPELWTQKFGEAWLEDRKVERLGRFLRLLQHDMGLGGVNAEEMKLLWSLVDQMPKRWEQA